MYNHIESIVKWLKNSLANKKIVDLGDGYTMVGFFLTSSLSDGGNQTTAISFDGKKSKDSKQEHVISFKENDIKDVLFIDGSDGFNAVKCQVILKDKNFTISLRDADDESKKVEEKPVKSEEKPTNDDEVPPPLFALDDGTCVPVMYLRDELAITEPVFVMNDNVGIIHVIKDKDGKEIAELCLAVDLNDVDDDDDDDFYDEGDLMIDSSTKVWANLNDDNEDVILACEMPNGQRYFILDIESKEVENLKDIILDSDKFKAFTRPLLKMNGVFRVSENELSEDEYKEGLMNLERFDLSKLSELITGNNVKSPIKSVVKCVDEEKSGEEETPDAETSSYDDVVNKAIDVISKYIVDKSIESITIKNLGDGDVEVTKTFVEIRGTNNL